MRGRRTGTAKWLILAAAVIVLATTPLSADERSPETIHVGVVNSLYRYVPDSMTDLALQPFAMLMKSQTGLTGEMSDAGSPENLARQIRENRLQLGVLFGIEYAWVRQKHSELRPLMIAINQDRHLRAHPVVGSDSGTKAFADLKGKVSASPQQSGEHCYVFLERRCLKCGQKPDKHFSKVTTPANAEDALDDVVESKVDAAVIDGPP